MSSTTYLPDLKGLAPAIQKLAKAQSDANLLKAAELLMSLGPPHSQALKLVDRVIES